MPDLQEAPALNNQEIDYKKLYFQKCKELEQKCKELDDLNNKISSSKEQEDLDEIQEQLCNLKIEKNVEILSDQLMWNYITKSNKYSFIDKIKYLLLEFGTKEPCNRFDVGNSIEFIIGDLIESTGCDVDELPNAKRIDLCINNNYNISIKYSSVGDVTLHNSNSSVNTDTQMTDLLLLTTNKLYLITNQQIKKHNIVLDNYIVNKGDSLKLKRSILKVLETNNYPFITDFDVNVEKKNCKNRLCSKVFYAHFLEEYQKSLLNK
tara:strand:- start:918 stop:1709 length:792 start_codon:yes stop_codon:yes gene_type:complete